MNLIDQEVVSDRRIDIPEPVLERLLLYRRTPLYRARRLEKFLGTPARIYVKMDQDPTHPWSLGIAVPEGQRYCTKEFDKFPRPSGG